MSIRLRLTLWYAAVLAISLALSSVLLYAVLGHVASVEVDSSLADKAHDIARGLRLRGELSFLPQRATLPRSDPLVTPSFYVQLLDPAGRVVDRSDTLGEDTLPVPPASVEAGWRGQPTYGSVLVSGAEVRLYTAPVMVNENLVGFIQVGRSLSLQNRTVAWLRNLSIIIGAAMVVAASGIGYLLARAALAPINRVTQAARAIGLSQRLDRRLQPYAYRDEIGQLIGTFNQMLDRLESAFAAQHRFVSDASHELRTPITTIRGNVEVLRRGNLDPAEQAEALQDIADEAERMSRLIAGLLALARADAGRHLERQPVALDEIVLDVHRRARLLSDTVTVALGPVEPVETLGDADHLRQLLVILIENAVKYNRPDGEVRVSLLREGAWLKAAVADTGVGIATEDLPHIFERFYRASSARQEGGTGLGLAIAKWIAEEHEGWIEVETAPGQGSVFTLWLPALRSTPAAALASSRAS